MKNVTKSSRRVMYLRDLKFMPVGCVAISLSKDRKTIRYQVSVLNPVDEFERSLARHIALGRLLEMPVRIKCGADKLDKFSINYSVMESIATNKKFPSRARKAARLWLRDNSVQ